MNFLVFRPGEPFELSLGDERAKHALKFILKGKKSAPVKILIPGRGRFLATAREAAQSLVFTVESQLPGATLPRLSIALPYVRPRVSQRLIADLAALGAKEILFFTGDLSERSYQSSHVWDEETIEKALYLGLSQGGLPRLPIVRKSSFAQILEAETPLCLLEKDSPLPPLNSAQPSLSEVCLILGPERGFSRRETDLLRERAAVSLTLGDPIYRAETAATSSFTLASLGLLAKNNADLPLS